MKIFNRARGRSKPRASSADVQAAPVVIGSTADGKTGQLKVDVAWWFDELVIVGGWCTVPASLELRVDGQPVETRQFLVDRADVVAHFALDESVKPGFALVARAGCDATIELAWTAAAAGANGVSRKLTVTNEKSPSPSHFHAIGNVLELLGSGMSSGPGGAAATAEKPAARSSDAKRLPRPRLVETRRPASEAIIVGAAADLDITLAHDSGCDVFALNGAHAHLQKLGVEPFALVTGDRRFLVRQGLRNLGSVRKIVTFDYALDESDLEYLSSATIVETFKCLGRDGFSTDARAGFFHGCSSFFLAVQYLASAGYKRVSTVGVKFPPPELYSRVNGNTGHPEFVYGIQLSNLSALGKKLSAEGITLRCRDANSNLALFI